MMVVKEHQRIESLPAGGTASAAGVFLMIHELTIGGTERQFVTLARGLAATLRVELGCLRKRGGFAEEVPNITEFDLGGGFLTQKAIETLGRLRRHLRALDISIAHSFDFYSNLAMVPAARLARVPVVIGSHRQVGDLLSAAKRRALVFALKRCDRVVCNSQIAAQHLRDNGIPQSSLVVIPNALPEHAFSQPRSGVEKRNDVRIGVIGRMNHPVKNQELFLRAVALLSPRYPQASFILVGDGSRRPRLEQMARELGLEGRTHFLGQRLDIGEVLASLDISVLPSASESLSNVILESMAAGKPVVATRVGGNPELVSDGQSGFLVSPDDEVELAAALERLILQPSLRDELGQRGRGRARAGFSLSSVATKYLELYAELLEEKLKPRKTFTGKWHDSRGHQVKIVLVGPSIRKLGGQSVQASLLMRSWDGDPAIDARFLATDLELPGWIKWVERIPFLRTLARAPLYWMRLWKEIGRADVAHVFSASYWSFLLAPAPALLIARARGRKALVNYRSGEARDHLSKSRTARALLGQADGLVVPSGYLRDVFAEFGLHAEVVPNLVDLGQFRYRSRKPLRPLLVCTRGFEPYYDIETVVRAFARVQSEYPNARLCLVGSGTLEAQIRRLVEQLKLAGVDFAGSVSRERIGEYYDRGDIFINASWLDNMPVSVLEALASGTPVVSTAAEGVRYIIEDGRTGLLSPVRDATALADNVIRLLGNPELALRLARNGFEESRRYHWDSLRPQWLDVYKRLLKLADERSQAPEDHATDPARAGVK
jgi:glycosyltransferase involved in cell wall biosynthesis